MNFAVANNGTGNDMWNPNVGGCGTCGMRGGFRKLSEYNQFMKAELARLKKSNPSMDAKQRFRTAAGGWNKKKTAKATRGGSNKSKTSAGKSSNSRNKSSNRSRSPVRRA